jgi:hypothetical protein
MEVIIAVEVARAEVVHATAASARDATATSERATTFIRKAKAWVTLAEREA